MPAKPRIMDLNRFTMFADVPGVENQKAKLSWGIRDGSARVTVFVFNTAAKRNEVISAPLGTETFLVFCDMFEKIIDASPGSKSKIDCYMGIRDAGGKLTGEKKLIGEFWFGVDNEGLIWVSLVDADKPRIKFTFKMWDYHKILKTDGTPLTDVEASKAVARTTIRALREVYVPAMAQFIEYVGKTSNNNSSNVTKAEELTLEDINF